MLSAQAIKNGKLLIDWPGSNSSLGQVTAGISDSMVAESEQWAFQRAGNDM